MKERLSFIDWAKAIAILCVCVGHFLPVGSTGRIFLYSFHVPVFFIISGFVFRAQDKPFCWGHIRKLSCRILIPYTVWFCISCIPQLFIYGDGIFSCVKAFFFVSGTTIWNSALWFLPCYYIVAVTHYFLTVVFAKNRIGKHLLICIVSWGIACVFDAFGILNCILGFNKCAFLLGVQHMGSIFRILYECKNRRVKSSWQLGSLTFFACGILSCILNAGDNISIMNLDYNSIYVYIPLSVVMSISFVYACMIFPKSKIVELISNNTIPVMCGHLFVRLCIGYFLMENHFLYISAGVWTALLSFAIVVVMKVTANRCAKLNTLFGFFGFQL